MRIEVEDKPQYAIVACVQGGAEEPLAPSAEALALLSALRAETRLLRGPHCSRVDLHVECSDGSGHYRIHVWYDWETPS